MPDTLNRLRDGSDTACDALVRWTRQPRRLVFDIGDVTFSQFAIDDAAELLEVRNHESVRRYMPNPAPLRWDDHLRWCQTHLCGGDILLFLARRFGRPVGFALLKAQADPGQLELGVMFAGEQQRSLLPGLAATYGSGIALEGFEAALLVTYASPNNRRALRLNQGLGLQPSESDKAGELCFRTPRDQVRQLPVYRRSLPRLKASLRVLETSSSG